MKKSKPKKYFGESVWIDADDSLIKKLSKGVPSVLGIPFPENKFSKLNYSKCEVGFNSKPGTFKKLIPSDFT